MRKLEFINVLNDPTALQAGDIVGFDEFPGHSKAQVKGSSGLVLKQFNATVQQPSFRGFVLSVGFKGDTPTSVIVMPMAPIEKGQRIPNDDKNLMISNRHHIEAMGLNTKVNWRLNYMPIALEITPKNFAIPEAGKIVRFGNAEPDLQQVVFGQVKKLMGLGILHSGNFLPDATARQLRGPEIAGYDRVIGAETRVSVYGNSRDAQALAETEAARAREKREAKKTEKAETARALRAEMNASPSGRIAVGIGLRFNEKASPDISLASAAQLELLDADTFLTVEEIGFNTLRTAFDGFRNDHTGVLGKLVSTELAPGKEELLKAELEVKLKSALTDFYRHLQNPKPKDKAQWEPHIIAYAPVAPDAAPK